MQITYELITPLIIYADEEGSKMICEFEVPGTEQIVESNASIRRIKSVQSQVSRVAKRTVTNQLRRVASRTLRQVLGGGMLGRTGTAVFNSAARTSGVGRGFTKEEKQAAIVDAFMKVKDNFKFNESTGNWEKGGGGGISIKSGGKISVAPKKKISIQKKEEQPGFESQLAKQPVTDKFDLEVLSRMLVAVAKADGEIGDEERDFLQSFLNESLGSIEDISNMGELSAVECEEVSNKGKKTILMLCWTISLVDFELNPAEEALLNEYAEKMRLNGRDKEEAIKMAKSYILEQVIDEDIQKHVLHDYAAQIGLTHEDADRCHIAWKRRNS